MCPEDRAYDTVTYVFYSVNQVPCIRRCLIIKGTDLRLLGSLEHRKRWVCCNWDKTRMTDFWLLVSHVAQLVLYRLWKASFWSIIRITTLMLPTSPNHVMAEPRGIFAASRFDHLILWRRKKKKKVRCVINYYCQSMYDVACLHAVGSGLICHNLLPWFLSEQEDQIKTMSLWPA